MITNIEDIKKSLDLEVELSGWTEDEPFRCVLRRPSMHQMVAGGTVPNPLIPTVERLFTATVPKEMTPDEQKRESEALIAIARATLREPSVAQLEEAGIQLTDNQIMEIYAFAITGAKGLDSFRGGARGRAGGNEQAHGRAAKRAAGDR